MNPARSAPLLAKSRGLFCLIHSKDRLSQSPMLISLSRLSTRMGWPGQTSSAVCRQRFRLELMIWLNWTGAKALAQISACSRPLLSKGRSVWPMNLFFPSVLICPWRSRKIRGRVPASLKNGAADNRFDPGLYVSSSFISVKNLFLG